jgi:hypothetical protein
MSHVLCRYFTYQNNTATTYCIYFQELLLYITSDLKVNVANVAAASQIRASAMLQLMIVGYYFGMPSNGVMFIFSFVTSGGSSNGRTDTHTRIVI